LNEGVIFLKKLGEEFKEARENIGVSLDEASNDLNIEKVMLENLEDGNAKAFKDILKVRELIALYSKYLGLDQDEMLDEYNDFMFATTTKISVDDIKEAQKRTQEPTEKKIKSPYTIEIKKDKNTIIFIVSAILLILILVLIFLLLKENIIG